MKTTHRLPNILAAMAVAALLLGGPGHLAAQSYQYGGSIPLDPELQAELDKRADVIRLGLNGTRLKDSGLEHQPFVRAMLFLADAVEADHLASAVVYFDSFAGDNMAIGVGDAQHVPMRVRADWSTSYELGELTAAVATIPLALRALEVGKLSLREKVADHLPYFAESPIGEITIEQLMRQMSGLPSELNVPVTVRNREQLLRLIKTIEPETSPGGEVSHSPLNMLLLGLVLDEINDKPLHEFAEEHYFDVLGMANTVSPMPDQLRVICAAGPMSSWHGRMVWAEPEDPAAYILDGSAGHGGLISNSDDMAIFARVLLFAHEVGIPDLLTKESMEFSLRPSRASIGGENQGLGWQLNGLGRGTFGYTASNGSALWVDPVHNVFIVVLANRNHPRERGTEFLDTILPMFLDMVRKAIPDMGDEA